VLALGTSILKQAFTEIESRHSRLGMNPAHILRVSTEHCVFDAFRTDHVEGHHQKATLLGPRIVTIHYRGQLGNCPSTGMLEYALKLVGKSHKKSDTGAMKANNAFTD